MGIMSWDLEGGFSTALPVRTPRLSIRCEYPDTDLPPTEVTFSLAASYGIRTAREAHDWFLLMMLATRGVRGRDGSGGGVAGAVLV